MEQRGHGLAGDSGRGHRYLQDHVPVRQAVTEEGHAVRALYLEAGVADVAIETGDEDLLAASIRRWEDMVATKTYLTGGNGSRHSDESFGDRFELPPDRAYNETCAAIASFHWSWRLLLATGDARYADLMERLLYNAFGASISTDGQKFFYVNPLQRRSDHVEGDDPARRHEWFSCACCPPNIMRLLASVQHYLASTDGHTLFLHQFAGAEITAPLDPGTLAVAMSADLPWTGEVTVRVKQAPDAPAGLALRVPAWSGPPRLQVNGERVDPGPAERGYLTVTRTWRPGDVLTWTFSLTPRWVYPHPRIDAVRGCVAIERGPLVYCFETVDQADGTDLDDLALVAGSALTDQPATLPEIGRTVTVDVDARPARAGPARRAALHPGGPGRPAGHAWPRPGSGPRPCPTSSGTTGTASPCGSGCRPSWPDDDHGAGGGRGRRARGGGDLRPGGDGHGHLVRGAAAHAGRDRPPDAGPAAAALAGGRRRRPGRGLRLRLRPTGPGPPTAGRPSARCTWTRPTRAGAWAGSCTSG